MLARSLWRLPVTYWFIINEISAVICCEDPSSGIRHSAERERAKRQEKEKGWWLRMWDTKMNRMPLMRKRNRGKVELTEQMSLHHSKKDNNKAAGTSRRKKAILSGREMFYALCMLTQRSKTQPVSHSF